MILMSQNPDVNELRFCFLKLFSADLYVVDEQPFFCQEGILFFCHTKESALEVEVAYVRWKNFPSLTRIDPQHNQTICLLKVASKKYKFLYCQ